MLRTSSQRTSRQARRNRDPLNQALHPRAAQNQPHHEPRHRRPDGYPQATTVTYANDGLTLYFCCYNKSQKVRNRRRSSKVSLTINQDMADTKRALALLSRKFKDMKDLSEEDLAETAFVRVQPKVVSMLDYRRSFGWTKLVRV
jgi:hypothetical protein